MMVPTCNCGVTVCGGDYFEAVMVFPEKFGAPTAEQLIEMAELARVVGTEWSILDCCDL